MRKPSDHMGRTLLECFLVLATALQMASVPPTTAWAEPPPTDDSADELTAEELAAHAEGLSSDSYLRRESASAALLKAGDSAIGPLLQVLEQGDLETTESAIGILQAMAIARPILDATDGEPKLVRLDPNRPNAWQELLKLSTMGGSRASRANTAIEEIGQIRRTQAVETLTVRGATIGIKDFVYNSVSELQRVIEIDDTYQGSDELLELLQWVDQIGYARVRGGAIRASVLRGVTMIPNLKTLSLLYGEMDLETLRVIGEMEALDHLEIRYVDLTDEMVDALATLPIRISLTLNGTGAKPQRVAALQQALPGLKIEFKFGGFLGVRCIDDGTTCVINAIVPESGAEAAGLQAFDVIIGADGKPIKKFSDLQDVINTHVPGESIDITYRRAGIEATTKAQLGKLTEP